MNSKNIGVIKKRIEIIKKSKKKIFFKGLKSYDYQIFISKLKKINFVIKSIDHLANGNIIVLKNSVNIKFLEKAKEKLNLICKTNKQISPKIKTDIKNGYYISKNLSQKGYSAVDVSFYFFSWNNDNTGIYNRIINIYKPLKILNGLKKNEITKNKPIDGIIERLHVIKYPLSSGKITRHYDPINTSIFNFGLYATEFGKDYDQGGFYVLDKNKKKKLIDKKIKKTDIVLFFPSMIHGVEKVRNKSLKKTDGRWFINVNHVQSHEMKNRNYTKKY